jgi:hypothetical protein
VWQEGGDFHGGESNRGYSSKKRAARLGDAGSGP